MLENGRFIIGAISPTALNRKPLKILDIIGETFRVLSFYREEKNIVVKSRVVGTQPSIMNGDADLMQIAIMNLVDNAFKYSLINKRLEWEVHFASDRYTFKISSASHPISASQKERIFAPFYRGKQKDHLNQRHGTGLGLPVAYKILKAHSESCELDVRSVAHDPQFGGGKNTFFFTMPYLTGIGESR